MTYGGDMGFGGATRPHKVIIACLCLAMPAFAADDHPSQSTDSLATPAVAAARGCLSRSVDDCIKQLEATFEDVDTERVAKDLERLNDVDVNGNRVAKNLVVMIAGKWPDSERLAGATVEFNSARLVTQIDVQLAENPQMANTEQEYDRTRLFEAFNLGAGTDCTGTSSLTIYKFFQNIVKPKIKTDPRETHFYETSVTTQNFRHAMNIPFCKHLFSYISSYGIDTSYGEPGNPEGFSSIYEASFSEKAEH